MRIEVIRCDMCKKEHDTQYVLPREWARVIQYDGYGLEKEYHFCSVLCLHRWTGKSLSAKDEQPEEAVK